MNEDDEVAGRWLLAKGEAAFDALYEWMTTKAVVVPDAVMTPLREIKQAANGFRKLEEKTAELERHRERLMESLRAADPKPHVSDAPCSECGNFSMVGDNCFVCEANKTA